MYKVTSRHIKDGEQDSLQFCPLALSLKENLDWNVEVCSFTVKKYYDSSMLKIEEYFDLSKKVENWVEKFDDDSGEVEPFTFEIEGSFIKMEDEHLENV